MSDKIAKEIKEPDKRLHIEKLLSGSGENPVLLSKAAADFTTALGKMADEKGSCSDINLEFNFDKLCFEGKENKETAEKVPLSVSLSTVTPIPVLDIKKSDVLFAMEEKTSAASAHEDHKNTGNNEGKYHVQMEAGRSGLPEGMARILEMFSNSVKPPEIKE